MVTRQRLRMKYKYSYECRSNRPTLFSLENNQFSASFKHRCVFTYVNMNSTYNDNVITENIILHFIYYLELFPNYISETGFASGIRRKEENMSQLCSAR
jgi:hypothetical protein